jgi:hypothetical protein
MQQPFITPFLTSVFLAPMPVSVLLLQLPKLKVMLIGLTDYDGQANNREQIFNHD